MAKKESAARKKLITQLADLAEGLPEDGLLFLIRQANTILYNMKVDELNKAAEDMRESRKAAAEKGPVKKTKKAQVPKPAAPEGLVHIEKGERGRNMFLQINNQRKIMDQDEIFQMVKIAHAAKTKKEGIERLFLWMKRERDDILVDAGLKPGSPAMIELLDYLREHFTLTNK